MGTGRVEFTGASTLKATYAWINIMVHTAYLMQPSIQHNKMLTCVKLQSGPTKGEQKCNVKQQKSFD
jgi:hypothetical protein